MREVDKPPAGLFVELGWDEDVQDDGYQKVDGSNHFIHSGERKHYRSIYPDELENNKDIFPTPSPFDTFEIKRGQTRGLSKGLFAFSHKKKDESGQDSNEKVAGIFKGIVHV